MTARLRALIVDDESLARSRLRTLLGDCSEPGADVLAEAGHAVQAMDALARESFDVVLLDIHMPGVDGIALAQKAVAAGAAAGRGVCHRAFRTCRAGF